MVDNRGYVLSFPQATTSYELGMHHRSIWKKIADLLHLFLPIPPMADTDRLMDWQLQPSPTYTHPVPLPALTPIKAYRLLQPAPWI